MHYYLIVLAYQNFFINCFRELLDIVDQLARTENAFLYLGTSLQALTNKFGKNLAVLQHLLNRSYQYYPTVGNINPYRSYHFYSTEGHSLLIRPGLSHGRMFIID
jgi:hypothetical protein